MKGVIATDKNSNTVLFCYPTGTTERRIKAINEALEKKKELLVNYEFMYPITLDSLQRDRIEISKMIKEFSDREHKQIFNVN